MGRFVRLEGAEIKPITLHHVFGQMLDLKLQLRLPDRMCPAFLLQFAEAVAGAAQLGFIGVNVFQPVGALCYQFPNLSFTPPAFAGLLFDRVPGRPIFRGLGDQTSFIILNVRASRRDQFRQFSLTGQHRRALRQQILMFLLMSCGCDSQLGQPGRGIFLFLQCFVSLRFHERDVASSLGDSFFKLCGLCLETPNLLVGRDDLAFESRAIGFK